METEYVFAYIDKIVEKGENCLFWGIYKRDYSAKSRK